MKRLFPVLSGILLSLLIGALGIAAQDGARVIKGGVLNGKAVSLPKPEYPDDAKKAGAEGAIAVTVTIDEEGNVTSAAASLTYQQSVTTNASGAAELTEPRQADPSLRESAEKAALAAKFAPTLLSGQPVKISGTIVYNFVAGNKPESLVKTVSGGVLNGKATSLPLPAYPPAAMAVKAGGSVTVQVLIDEDGNVFSAEAVSGHPLLRGAAADAARLARFSPTLLNGGPVKVSGVLVYNFAP